MWPLPKMWKTGQLQLDRPKEAKQTSQAVSPGNLVVWSGETNPPKEVTGRLPGWGFRVQRSVFGQRPYFFEKINSSLSAHPLSRVNSKKQRSAHRWAFRASTSPRWPCPPRPRTRWPHPLRERSSDATVGIWWVFHGFQRFEGRGALFVAWIATGDDGTSRRVSRGVRDCFLAHIYNN